MKDLEKRISAIEQRNLRVERDKQWETSAIRRGSIAALTYIVVVIFLLIINNNAPLINAIVPVVGFLLSTLALDKVRKAWERKR